MNPYDTEDHQITRWIRGRKDWRIYKTMRKKIQMTRVCHYLLVIALNINKLILPINIDCLSGLKKTWPKNVLYTRNILHQ